MVLSDNPRVRTDVLLGAAQHDALEQGAQRQQPLQAALVLAQDHLVPRPVVIEWLIRQKLQQPLYNPPQHFQRASNGRHLSKWS